MAEPQDHVLEMLKKMRRENTARFNAIARDMSAIHHRLDLIAAARDDIAAAQAIASTPRRIGRSAWRG